MEVKPICPKSSGLAEFSELILPLIVMIVTAVSGGSVLTPATTSQFTHSLLLESCNLQPLSISKPNGPEWAIYQIDYCQDRLLKMAWPRPDSCQICWTWAMIGTSIVTHSGGPL